MEEKELAAKGIVKNYMWWSMGAGLIPVPFVDLAAVSGVQLKMLKDMSDIYDIKFSENKGKSIVSALLGSIVPNSLSVGNMGSLLKMLPVVGSVLGGLSMSLFSGAATYAIGKVFIQHFEAGGTFLDFNPVTVKEYFQNYFAEGKTIAKEMSEKKGKKPETV
ncbi:MAG: YcjF family protein [Ignavibacteriales bacterium]